MTTLKPMISIIITTILVLVSWLVFSVSDSKAALDHQQVARQGLHSWLDDLRVNSEFKNYGFTDENELDEVILGDPYPVFQIIPSALKNYQKSQRVSNLISNEQWWEFPLLVNGEARGLLTVVQLDGEWKIIKYGQLSTSQKLLNVQKQFVNRETTITLLKLFTISGTFALLNQSDQESLVYIESYPGLFHTIDQSSLTQYEPELLIPQIRQAFNDVMKAEDTSSMSLHVD